MKKMYIKKKFKKTPIRHTHRTAAALEDALAVAWDIIREQSEALTFAEGRARRIIAILQQARQGPHAYDPDNPSGIRIKINKR